MRFYNDVTALPLRSYDGFIVFGGLQFSSSASYLSRHRTSDLAAAPGRPRALMSGGFLDAVLMRRVSHSVGVHVAKALEELDQGPVLFMSAALPSDAVLGSAEAKWQDYRDLARRGDGPAYHQRFLTQLDRALGPGIRRLSQPAATISGEVFTAAEWMRGSFRMNPRRDVAHGEEDMIHTNPSYGALQIDAAMEAFAAL
ncbi:hypothetical protein [Paracoccus aminophilus]|nr:hypothetical protein [Paracoccus aminophilus]